MASFFIVFHLFVHVKFSKAVLPSDKRLNGINVAVF